MERYAKGIRVQIFCGESDQAGHKPRYLAILELLRREGAAGATVTRGIAGFGRDSLLKTASVLRLSMDLPVVITWIDVPERVERLLPRVREIASSGVITVEDVGVASYGERAVGRLRFDLQVVDVMTRPVRSVRADASVQEAAEALLGQPFRALPVADEAGRLVGVVSNGDLVARAGLGARVELLNVLDPGERSAYLEALPNLPVSRVMTAAPVTLSPRATLADATRLLADRKLKRLPVVDEDGLLVGIVSRADVLRAVAEAFPSVEPEPGTEAAAGGMGGAAGDGRRFARDVMRSPAPTVDADADLPAVLDAVCSTRLNRAVVVDASGVVVGVVSDWTVLRALGPDGRSIVGKLMGMAAPTRTPSRTARELVAGPDLSVAPETPLSDVARLMTEHRRKIVPVVDADRRLLGIIDRADLLTATHAALSDLATAETLDDED